MRMSQLEDSSLPSSREAPYSLAPLRCFLPGLLLASLSVTSAPQERECALCIFVFPAKTEHQVCWMYIYCA